MNSEQLYKQRLERIMKAVRLEPVDKIPVAPCANAYWARQQGVLMKDYVSDMELACTTNIAAMEALGGVDATQNTVFSPYTLPAAWMSKVAVPGKELGDDELWQVLETGLITDEDYDDILENGFGQFYERFKKERLDDNDASLAPFLEYTPIAGKRFYEAGIPCICDFLMFSPIEYFCGGRTLETFLLDDLMGNPDKMEAVFKVTMEHLMKVNRGVLEAIKPICVWVGGWRGAPAMLSPALWERFVWPYMKQYAELCLELGVIPMFHLDSDWTSQLRRFLEMPAKRCIMALDSQTDIRKAREVLKGHMCILGDVPAQLLAFGTPENVYAHVQKLIDDIGPEGYIVASGCDIPANAKPENVRAMCDAANNYFKDKAK